MKTPFRYSLLALFYLILLVLSGCSGGSGSGTGTGTDPRIGFTYPDPADYSTLTWTDAFTAAHDNSVICQISL